MKLYISRHPTPLILLAVATIIAGISLITLSFSSKNQKPDTVNTNEVIEPQVEGAKSQDNQLQTPADTQILTQTTTQGGQTVKVIRVVDGDTIEIEGGQKVRYIGINTPETVDPRRPVQCFGKEAAAKNRELVEGKNVYLEKDVSETDKYGRLLRYIYLPARLDSESERAGEAGIDQTFVNDYLVREGYAYASAYPPDVKYQDQLTQAQQEAQHNSRGLWNSCQSNQPSAYKLETNQSGCLIKGNISSSGEKIYHMPGQNYYDKTVIDEARGERWFCTEDTAKAAGFRKSKV